MISCSLYTLSRSTYRERLRRETAFSVSPFTPVAVPGSGFRVPDSGFLLFHTPQIHCALVDPRTPPHLFNLEQNESRKTGSKLFGGGLQTWRLLERQEIYARTKQKVLAGLL